jgi:hypothetical protein
MGCVFRPRLIGSILAGSSTLPLYPLTPGIRLGQAIAEFRGWPRRNAGRDDAGAGPIDNQHFANFLSNTAAPAGQRAASVHELQLLEPEVPRRRDAP